MATFQEMGLLGMNKRNADYTLIHNPRSRYPLVDDKLLTKSLLERNELPTPEIYFSIQKNYELKLLHEIKYLKDFVLKPSRGAEGRGILIVVDKKGEDWIKPNGERVSLEDLEYHASNILAGLYSLGGVDDRAFGEYRIRSHEIFRSVVYFGAPDIRLILYRGVPIMSMLRLPTKESGGRGNLHQGAVGAGIHMKDGVTLGGVHRNKLVKHHPDTGEGIAGLKIPFWNDILEIAVRSYDVFKLGYIGVDFVIDHILGPLILELNARPGLNIQLANAQGLLHQIEKVDRYGKNVEQLSWQRRLEVFREILQ